MHCYRNHLVYAAVVFAAALLVGSPAAPAQPSSRDAAQKVPFRHVVVDSKAPPEMQTKTAGDLNGDGLTDLVVAGSGWATLALLLALPEPENSEIPK